MVDEQHAVEMVDLMLETGRQQAVQFLLMRRAVTVEPFGTAPRRALDLGILLGDRQAAFIVAGQVVAQP